MFSLRRISNVLSILVLVLAGFALLGPVTANASNRVSYENAVPGTAPSVPSKAEVYLDEAGQKIDMGEGVPAIDEAPSSTDFAIAAACTPVSGRDNPHYSSGDVSGHGW